MINYVENFVFHNMIYSLDFEQWREIFTFSMELKVKNSSNIARCM